MNVTIIKYYEVYPGLTLKPGTHTNLEDRLARRAINQGYATSPDYEPQSESQPTQESTEESAEVVEKKTGKKRKQK